MPREKTTWKAASYCLAADEIRSTGRSVTYEAEQRAQISHEIDDLVNPKTHGGKRESLNLMVQQPDGTFLLTDGIAMPVKRGLDTTGSMGGNVDVAFRVIPRDQLYLIQGSQPLLSRYHTQIATSTIQDHEDRFAYQHSEFEPDNEVDVQMRKFDVQREGGDPEEEYHFDLFYSAYRTVLAINKYGLKGYNFIVGDQRGRNSISRQDALNFLGVKNLPDEPTEDEIAMMPSQWQQSTKSSAISAEELGQRMLEKWHGFFLQVGESSQIASWWRRVLGPERAIVLPQTEYIAEVEAVIIGLTEGNLDLQNAADFLVDVTERAYSDGHSGDNSMKNLVKPITKSEADRIVRAVGHIPLRAQAILPNFDKIPLKGARFASRSDVWPIGVNAPIATKPGKIDWENQL